MTAEPNAMLTQVLHAASQGDAKAAAELLPLVYHELRRLAAARMARIPHGNTLQPTALVHEAFLRVIGEQDPGWNGRGHFFAAAATAMKQILIEQARRKAAVKHGGGRRPAELREGDVAVESPVEDILALDEALERLRKEDERKARIVDLRYFAGLSREETAAVMGVSLRTIDREWRYIIARLHKDLGGPGPDHDDHPRQ